MFVLTKEARPFKHKVQVVVPQENGTPKTVTFMGHFRLLKREAYEAALKEWSSTDGVPSDEATADFFMSFMTGWSEVQDVDGNDVPFSRDNLMVAVGEGPFVNGVLEAYSTALTPQAKAARQRKN